jgi:hypothetical protein
MDSPRRRRVARPAGVSGRRLCAAQRFVETREAGGPGGALVDIAHDLRLSLTIQLPQRLAHGVSEALIPIHV